MEFDENTYVAMLMRKNVLSEGCVIYSPVHPMVGTYDEDNNIFKDNLDSDFEFFSIDDEVLLLSEVSDGFYNPFSIKDLYEMYADEENSKYPMGYFVNLYGKQCKSIAYLAKRDNEELNISLQEINIGKKDEFDDEYIDSEDILDDEDEQDDDIVLQNRDNDTNNFHLQISFKKLKDLLNSGEYTNKQLMEICDSLKSSVYDYDEMIKLIESSLKGNDDKVFDADHRNKEKMYQEVFSNDKFMDKDTYLKEKTNIDIGKILDVGSKIKKTVIAQDDAIDRFLIELAKMQLSKQDKKGMLLTGSTGVGKTEILKNVAKYIDRPIKIIDSTQLTSPGYTGKSIEEFLWELYVECGKDVKKAEQAIIVFDEIDKKGSPSKSDVSGKAVLNILLKFLDGTDYSATANTQMKMPGSYVSINTANMIVIGAGAFSDVYKAPVDKVVGFNSDEEKMKSTEPTTEDFIEKAMMPDEFLGRFPVRIHLNDLSAEDLKQILLKSDKSPIKDQIEIFDQIGFNLNVTNEFLDVVSKRALEKHTGARGLQEIITQITWKPFKEAIDNVQVCDTIEFGKNIVDNTDDFVISKRDEIKDMQMYSYVKTKAR